MIKGKASVFLTTASACALFFVFQTAQAGTIVDQQVDAKPVVSMDEGGLSIAALDIALEEVKLALEDVELNLNHTTRRIEKASLKSARSKLIDTIKALEWQRNNLIKNRLKLDEIRDTVEHKRVKVEAKRRAIEERIVEQLDAQTEGISGVRERVISELEQTREELAAEIEQLQLAIDDQDDIRATRLRALREAEMVVSDMEKHHLSAIAAAEAELKRARLRLEQKLKEQVALNDKFKYYSLPAEN